MSSPVATYLYDASSVDGDPNFMNPVGRLVKAQQFSQGVSAITYFDYDAVGRVQHQGQCAINNCAYGSWWIVTNGYDLAGDLTLYTDGFFHNFTQTFDSAGRPLQLTSSWSDSGHPSPLATAGAPLNTPNGYAPTGQLLNLTLANGVIEARLYNSRLQPCRINWNTSSTTFSAASQCTGNQPSGNLLDFTYGFNSGTSNNGNIATWNAVGNPAQTVQTFTRSYTYDSLNRLSAMSSPSDPSGCTGLSWSYDAWGNRTSQSLTSGSCSFHQPMTTFTAQNQFNIATGYTYDAAGNMTHDASHQYFYDAENHLLQVDGTLGTCSTATACYVNDSSGQRVVKYTNPGATYQYYIYGSDGQIVADTDTSANWNHTYIHFGGNLTALYTGSATYFYHRDHLGSTRLGTDLTGHVSGTDYDFLPFGEQIAGTNATYIKFTGKERDSESGLDNFGARYNSSSLGRFMSPDPLSGSPGNPQSWNRYAYVSNNPLNATDPSGMCSEEDGFSGCDWGFDSGFYWGMDWSWAWGYGNLSINPLTGAYDPSAGYMQSPGLSSQYLLQQQMNNAMSYLNWGSNFFSALGQNLNPFNPSGSFSQEANAIGQSLGGIVTGNWAQVASSYNNNPLGQTAAFANSSDPINKYLGYYGTRGALIGSGVSATAAGALSVLDALGITNLGEWKVGWKGGEFTLKDPTSPYKSADFRFNPTGDWDNPNPNSRPPHWHQRPGIKRHLPWDWWF
jgi:RHS repeat-associated protein